MLDLGETEPGEKTKAGVNEADLTSSSRPVMLALVPNSSIQFIEFEMSEELVARTGRRFFEDHAETGEPSLHLAAASDGVFYHPVTNTPCDPARTYTIGGVDALSAFVDAWVPLPYMRVSSSDAGEGARLVLDEGPSNWTRVHIAREASSRGAISYRVVLAVDTAVEPAAGAVARAYVGPTVEDLKSCAAFRFSDNVEDIAWFVSEVWVDDWIKSTFAAGTTARGREDSHGELEHLAAYLTLLSVLKEACDLPVLRFLEPNAVGAYAAAVPVDLALDLGSSRIGAVLLERLAGGGAGKAGVDTSKRTMWQLPLRDLTCPSQKSVGVWSSALTFSRATFGHEALSRWSGRINAFRWPIPVRLGPEAARLAVAPATAEAATGVSSAMHYVWDERPSRHVWRFAGGAGENGARRNPVVSGSILAHLSESGDLIEVQGAQGATTKPRFSRSSLVTLTVAEILLQAMSAVNDPVAREARGQPLLPRRLDRVVVAPPAGMCEAELAVLRRRVEAAVKLVWQTMNWRGEEHPLAPPPPSISIGADAQTALQIAYLENEIAYKFRGNVQSLLSIAGRARGGFAGSRVLRIATLDIGAATTNVAVATWEVSPGGALAATRQLIDGFEVGCNDVVKVIAQRFVVKALAQRLAECKHPDPARLIQSLLGEEERGRPAWVGDLGRRLTAELLVPAATALLRLYSSREEEGVDAPSELSIATLLASVGIDAKGVADRLDIGAADDGADGFAPLEVAVPFLMRELAMVVREVLRPMLGSVVRVLTALDCDMVLLSGGGASLPAVAEMLLAGIPLRPDRVTVLARHRFADWLPVPAGGDSKVLTAAGALVQAFGAFGEGGPAIIVKPPEKAMADGFVGKISAGGRLLRDDVLFELGASAARESADGRARACWVGLPASIGIRVTSLETWPARALWAIERDPESGSKAPKLPLKVTLDLAPAERGQPMSLRLVSAIDADGSRLDRSEVVLRLKTRSFAQGYWLDTGHLMPVSTGNGP